MGQLDAKDPDPEQIAKRPDQDRKIERRTGDVVRLQHRQDPVHRNGGGRSGYPRGIQGHLADRVIVRYRVNL